MPFVFGVPRFSVAPSGPLMKMSGGATVLCHTVENILAALAVCSIHHEKHSALVFAFNFFFLYKLKFLHLRKQNRGNSLETQIISHTLFVFSYISYLSVQCRNLKCKHSTHRMRILVLTGALSSLS